MMKKISPRAEKKENPAAQSDETSAELFGCRYTRSDLVERTLDIVPELCSSFDDSSRPSDGTGGCGASVGEVAELLVHMSEICNPKELLLALLEQADVFKTSAKYSVLLTPVRRCIERLNDKSSGNDSQFRSLAIAAETLYAHLASLELPTEGSDCVEELQTIDTCRKSDEIADMTGAFLDFLEPFVLTELSHVKKKEREKTSSEGQGHVVENNAGKTQAEFQRHQHHIDALTLLLVRVLDRPLAYVDLSNDDDDATMTIDDASSSGSEAVTKKNDPSASKLTCRKRAERCVDLLGRMQQNVVRIMVGLKEKDKIQKLHSKLHRKPAMGQKSGEIVQDLDQYDADDVEDDYSVEEPLPELGLATFSYLVFGEGISLDRVPQVFSTEFLLEINTSGIVRLLAGPESMLVHKGLMLTAGLLGRIEIGSLSSDLVESNNLRQMLAGLVSAMTSSRVKDLARLSVQMLRLLLKCFSCDGRRRVLEYLLVTVQHFGVQGHVITLIKDEIDEELNAREQLSEHFTGPGLQRLFVMIFSLSATAPFIDQSDRVMSALNLLRYLMIRDHATDNKTGVWNSIPLIRDKFLTPVNVQMNTERGTALDALKGLSVSDESDGNESVGGENKKKDDGDQLEVQVGGEVIPGLTDADKREMLRSSLIVLEMMCSVLGRVEECIQLSCADVAKKASGGVE